MPVYRGSTLISSAGSGNPVPFGQLLSVTANTVTANRAYMTACRLTEDATINRLGTNIFTSAGNIDIGIYEDNAGVPGDLLISTGSVASPGTGFRVFTVAETVIPAGRVWMAFAGSSGTLAVYAATQLSTTAAGFHDPSTSTILRTHHKDTAFPLPDPMSSPTATTTFSPIMWANFA